MGWRCLNFSAKLWARGGLLPFSREAVWGVAASCLLHRGIHFIGDVVVLIG